MPSLFLKKISKFKKIISILGKKINILKLPTSDKVKSANPSVVNIFLSLIFLFKKNTSTPSKKRIPQLIIFSLKFIWLVKKSKFVLLRIKTKKKIKRIDFIIVWPLDFITAKKKNN